MTDASTIRKAKIFISYSRDDFDFADQLVAALEGTGFDPLIDRHSIPGGEDWKAQLRHMIVEADSVVFVLSPRSAASSKSVNSTGGTSMCMSMRSSRGPEILDR